MITVFTPTYNRADLLPTLYKSLVNQTNFDFEWIIIDDGSTDDTAEVVARFKSENNKFPITFVHQKNLGKYVAINHAVKIAQGELFFIVDSDDFLAAIAIERIYHYWGILENTNTSDGLAFNRCYLNGQTIGQPQYTILDCSPLLFRYQNREQGDKAEIIKTSVFKSYPFPENKEKFFPEAYFFNKLKNLRYINENIYYCEYLEGGLTANSYSIRRNSPINTTLYYYELSQYPVLSHYDKFRSAINFYRFKLFTTQSFPRPYKSNIINVLAKVLANCIFLLKDNRK